MVYGCTFPGKKVNKRSSIWLSNCYTLLHIILTSLPRPFVFR